jgi:hypothetical protein
MTQFLTMHKETKSLLKWPEVSPFKSLSNDFPYAESKKHALNTVKYLKTLDYYKLDKYGNFIRELLLHILNIYIKHILHKPFESDNYQRKCGVQ